MAAPEPAPIRAYRTFTVEPGGDLRGLRGQVWPVDEPMVATHVRPSLLAPPSEPPVLCVAWRRKPRLVRVALTLLALAATVAIGVLDPLLLVIVGAAWHGAVMTLRGRHGIVSSTVLATGALIAVSGIIVCELSAALLVADGPGRHGINITTLVFASSLTVPMFVAYVIAVGRRPHHDCPAPPPRFQASNRASCGIYGFTELASAVREMPSRSIEAWVPATVVAAVDLWGRVWPHEDGWRASHARIAALCDDGSGNVEVPAARYGVAVTAIPAEIAGLRSTRPTPRWVQLVFRIQQRCRAWAARYRSQAANPRRTP